MRVAGTLQEVEGSARIFEPDRCVAHGRVRISGGRILGKPLQPGRYELVAKDLGGLIYTPFEIESGQTTRVDTLFYPGRPVGFVFQPTKQRSVLLRYELRDDQSRVRLAQTLCIWIHSAYPGYWRFPLPPSDYELRVTNLNSGKSSVARFRVAGDPSSEITDVPFPIPPDKH